MLAASAAPKLADLAAAGGACEDWTNVARSTASLIVITGENDPAEIASRFDTPPTRLQRQGEPVRPGSPRVSRLSACHWQCRLDQRLPLTAHVQAICRLTERNAEVIAALPNGCDVRWFCGHFRDEGRGGFFLPGSVLRPFQHLPIRLCLDIYPPTLPYDPAEDDATHISTRWTFVHLRIVSNAVSAAEITAMLETTPTWCCERTDRVRPDRLPLDGAIWLLDGGATDDDDEWQELDTFASFIDGRRDALYELSRRARISLRIVQASESGQTGPFISPDLTRRLFQAPIDLAYVVYRADQLPSEDVVLFD